MSAVVIREETPQDRPAVLAMLRRAFAGPHEAALVERLTADGDVVLSLVAERHGDIRGHILFSRLTVETPAGRAAAVALAPLPVDPDHQREGIGGMLIDEAHLRLETAGETLILVLGDPAYYGRFGYSHARAAGFDSAFQGAALQARATGEAPQAGRLVYAAAFQAL
ncbi:N-acetyltransferase [Aquibium sp. A9E412]|uniref:GNAT family N-acetyltransferase n=1 Tax=Aquibium sp. A9E412 TaxID=2976767 RepID=UPI0025AF2652|nr:N-acetyltransferase [Aquibium sp. A9E412]MDN2566267.1 N-acetyltransferase [Aquibium sp. A9E412]